MGNDYGKILGRHLIFVPVPHLRMLSETPRMSFDFSVDSFFSHISGNTVSIRQSRQLLEGICLSLVFFYGLIAVKQSTTTAVGHPKIYRDPLISRVNAIEAV